MAPVPTTTRSAPQRAKLNAGTVPTLLQRESRTPQALAWTRDDCQRMEDIGLLPERWELLRGEVISKMGQKVPHGRCVLTCLAWLMEVFGKRHVLSQITIDVSPADNPTSEPEPDVIVLTVPSPTIEGNPRPAQILLLIEVADTTLAYDLKSKAPLYAAAGIPEYWVMDVRGRQLHQHRQPVDVAYQSVTVLSASDAVAAPGRTQSAAVGELFG